MAVIEFARNVLHMEDADSTEMAAKTQYPVIDLMDSQLNVTEREAPCVWEPTNVN